MHESNDVLAILLNAYHELDNYGRTIIISGESGIGKSYYSEKFFSLLGEDVYLIRANGLFVEQSAYGTINSAVYKHISERVLDTEITLNLLQKIAAGIPRFGQYLSLFFDTNKRHNALFNLVKKSGINPNEPNIFNIIGFFEKLAKEKPIVLYCDNIQWFDRDSWRLIVSLISVIPERKWLCLINYTTNAEIVQISHYDFADSIHQLRSNPNVSAIDIDRMPQKQLQEFCEEALGLPLTLSEEKELLLYEYSKGVPYYIKTILQVLKNNNYIILRGKEWVSEGNWISENIRETLRNCVKERVAAIYRKIPGSRDTLELASVFGEEFQDDAINGLFEIKDSFNLLSSIEAKFRLIQYLVDDRAWMFEHSIIQNFIYQSIGTRAKDFHLKIAHYLESSGSVNNLKIAFHFQQAGEQALSTDYHFKEAEELLTSGCYNSSSDLIDKISEDWMVLFSLTDQQKKDFEILKGKVKFHTVQYQAALEIFISILNESKGDKFTQALSHRWLGRIYSKLNSQTDFQSGLNHLETAKEYYEDMNSLEDLGFVYADLVVAYAHLNRLKEAEASFRKAEQYFNITKNKLGMLRLQRRSVIFMDIKFSAVLLEKTGLILKNMNLPNEYIMTINNSASQFIYIGELRKAKEMLMDAMSISVNVGGFGQVYIYNNLSLISYIENELGEAAEYLNLGRNSKFRFVEQLIIDINESVVLAKKMPISSMMTIFDRLYRKALEVGENDYLIPTKINFAKAVGRSGNWESASSLLYEIRPILQSRNCDYENTMWYFAIKECLDALNVNDDTLALDEALLNNILIQSTNNKFHQSDYCLISMQFYSDN